MFWWHRHNPSAGIPDSAQPRLTSATVLKADCTSVASARFPIGKCLPPIHGAEGEHCKTQGRPWIPAQHFFDLLGTLAFDLAKFEGRAVPTHHGSGATRWRLQPDENRRDSPHLQLDKLRVDRANLGGGWHVVASSTMAAL